MRKSLSIFFLSLFLLYHVGYLGYYWYSARKIDDQWLGKVEITPDMKHVTIPVDLPYWSNQEAYQPTHGKININGKRYRKVFQKYDSNKIHLLLAEDRASEQLERSIADWVRMMTDTETPESGKADLLKSAIKEYVPNQSTFLSDPITLIAESHPAGFYQASEGNLFAEHITPPPQV